MQFPRLFPEGLDRQKAVQAIQRISYFVNAKPGLVYAVMYYADREHLAYTGRTIYGETYLAYHHAAVPSWANHILMTLIMPTRDISLYMILRKYFTIDLDLQMVNRDMTCKGEELMDFERNCIDQAMHWYRHAKEREVLLSRRDPVWCKTAPGAPIEVADLLRAGGPAFSAEREIPPPKKIDLGDADALQIAARAGPSAEFMQQWA